MSLWPWIQGASAHKWPTGTSRTPGTAGAGHLEKDANDKDSACREPLGWVMIWAILQDSDLRTAWISFPYVAFGTEKSYFASHIFLCQHCESNIKWLLGWLQSCSRRLKNIQKQLWILVYLAHPIVCQTSSEQNPQAAQSGTCFLATRSTELNRAHFSILSFRTGPGKQPGRSFVCLQLL